MTVGARDDWAWVNERPEVERTSDGIVDHPGADYFGVILGEYLQTGAAGLGVVGSARRELLDAADLVRFVAPWMTRHLAGRRRVDDFPVGLPASEPTRGHHPGTGERRGDAVTRAPAPPDAGERELLLGWLAFHRDALAAKCDGLSPDELVAAASLPSRLTLLGLVRHLTEMERVYATYALGPSGPLRFVYGDYEDGTPEWDFDVDASMVEESMRAWARERAAADEAIAAHSSPDDASGANGRSLRWNLLKLVGEYARHNGHADLLRERVDGVTGE